MICKSQCEKSWTIKAHNVIKHTSHGFMGTFVENHNDN